MKRLILALVMFTPAVHAFDWPWSEHKDPPGNHCVGFLGSGLADDQVTGWSRTQLWLAWGRATRDGLPQDASFKEYYQAGSDQFDALVGTSQAPDLLELAEGECGLDRH